MSNFADFENLFDTGIFKKVEPESVVSTYGDFIVQAFEEDKADENFLKIGKKYGRNGMAPLFE
jgi:hypothetical protein